jgi:hypothetical protein
MAALAAIILLPTTRAAVAGAEGTSPQLKTLIDAAGLTPWTFRGNPSFELPDTSGKMRSLAADFKGQVVLLYMLAEW